MIQVGSRVIVHTTGELGTVVSLTGLCEGLGRPHAEIQMDKSLGSPRGRFWIRCDLLQEVPKHEHRKLEDGPEIEIIQAMHRDYISKETATVVLSAIALLRKRVNRENRPIPSSPSDPSGFVSDLQAIEMLGGRH